MIPRLTSTQTEIQVSRQRFQAEETASECQFLCRQMSKVPDQHTEINKSIYEIYIYEIYMVYDIYIYTQIFYIHIYIYTYTYVLACVIHMQTTSDNRRLTVGVTVC